MKLVNNFPHGPTCQICYQKSHRLVDAPLVSGGKFSERYLKVYRACDGCYVRYVTDEGMEWMSLGRQPSTEWYEDYAPLEERDEVS